MPDEKFSPEVNQLHQVAYNILKIPENSLARTDLGQLGFEHLRHDFHAIKALCGRVTRCAWQGISPPQIQNLAGIMQSLNQSVNNVTTFNAANSQNFQQERNNLSGQLRNAWIQVYNAMAAPLCFCENGERDPQESARTINDALIQVQAAKQTFDAELIKIRDQMTKNKEEMAAVISELQESAEGAGVTKQAIHFKKLADEYRNFAVAWLIASIVAGAVLATYVINFQVEPKINEQTVELVARLVPHLVIITLLSTALLFCLRNFASLVHNVIVNRHRQTALATFQTFVLSASDPETRNAVLIQATQAIFAPQNSGFLKSDPEMPQVSQITEIVRGVTGKDKD